MFHGSMKNNIYDKFSLTVTDIVEKAVKLYGLIHPVISNKIAKLVIQVLNCESISIISSSPVHIVL